MPWKSRFRPSDFAKIFAAIASFTRLSVEINRFLLQILPLHGPIPRLSGFRGELRRTASQSADPRQDFREDVLGDGHFRHLEGCVSTASDDLRPDLYQLHQQAPKGPMLDLRRKCQSTQKVTQVVG